MHEWTVGGARTFTGLANYARLASDERFIASIGHTLVYTFLAVVLPLIFGTLAALIFNARLPLRGVLRGLFVMPMMATPVAIALVWTMMFHPQLGVLNYLLSLIGIGPQEWVFNPRTVIPSLVLVETWQWTPLVMLIVLGGLAAIPTEPYESAAIDGASAFQRFRYITLPMIAPFLMVAVIIRTIDALKSFDIIYAITQGGPGHGLGDHQPLPLQRRLRLLRHRLRIGDRRRVLRPRHRPVAPDAPSPSADEVDRTSRWRMNRDAFSTRSACGSPPLVLVSPAILFFLWMISLSLKFEVDNAAYPPILIPERFAWKNYTGVFESNRFGLFFINSLIVTGAATGLALLIGVPAGYGIARMKATKAAVVVLIARMTPGLSYLIPLFLLFQWLGLMGTLVPQIIAHLVITVPIVIWIMIGYFETTPMELEEAAVIDGARPVGGVPPCGPADRQAGHHGRLHPGRDLLLEQFRLRRRAGRAGNPHPAGRGLQHAVVRAVELGAAGCGCDHRDLARPRAHRHGAAADRGGADGRGRQGRIDRLASSTYDVGFPAVGGDSQVRARFCKTVSSARAGSIPPERILGSGAYFNIVATLSFVTRSMPA